MRFCIDVDGCAPADAFSHCWVQVADSDLLVNPTELLPWLGSNQPNISPEPMRVDGFQADPFYVIYRCKVEDRNHWSCMIGKYMRISGLQ